MILARLGKTSRTNRRLVVLCLFLTLVFLPLHMHGLTDTPKVTKECSCLHGSRTEVGWVPVATQWAAPIQFALRQTFEPQSVSQVIAGFQAIRAPPIL